MKTKICYLVIFFVLFLSFSSCIKDNFNFDKWDKEVQYEAGFAAPAIWGDLSFTDALQRFDSTGLLIENDEGYVSMQYKTNVSSAAVQEIIYLPDQSTSGSIASQVFEFDGFDQYGDTISFTLNQDLIFTMFNTEAEIDSILLKSGILDIRTTSTYGHSAKLYVTLPSVIKNGEPFTRTFTYVPGGGSVHSLGNDFNGYKIDLTQTATNFNEIPVEVKLTLFYSGNGVPNTGSIDFSVDIKDMEYKTMHGYFGLNTLFFESDTIDISLFNTDDWTIEKYRFEDPKLEVFYTNSYGVPSQFYFTHMMAASAVDGSEYNIIDYGVGLPIGESNPYDVSYSTSYGDVMLDSLKLNRNNSNINDIVNKRPKWIQFKAKATTNPAGNSHNNFVADNSKIDVEVVMEFPLWGYIYNFNLQDTLEVDFSGMFDENNPITRALLRVEFNNGFPIEAISQIYITDQNYYILDSVFSSGLEQIIGPAKVDANGRVSDITQKITKIEYNLDRLEKIKGGKYVIICAHAHTTNAANDKVVKIFTDYKISFDIGFEVDIKYDGNIDDIGN
ncbi:MAG TPA: hypothetical protein PLW77_05645 [Bacteroidales bacterium]|nr:hypothetical protein [Bacteroidales bacterium]HQB22404.1 hypothetical protein [Bacteroidales bacterium]